MMNWGFVDGKMQMWLFWDSWKKLYIYDELMIWFYEVFCGDGMFYCIVEIDLICIFVVVLRGVVLVLC